MENKHYIRIESGNIAKGFSDAFEQPQEGDICINENGGRHFEIDGVINPPQVDGGVYRYKFVDGTIVLKTLAEIEAEKAALPTPVPSPSEQLRADVDYLLIAELTREELL